MGVSGVVGRRCFLVKNIQRVDEAVDVALDAEGVDLFALLGGGQLVDHLLPDAVGLVALALADAVATTARPAATTANSRLSLGSRQISTLPINRPVKAPISRYWPLTRRKTNFLSRSRFMWASSRKLTTTRSTHRPQMGIM